jgi:hypothetical protein
MSRFRIPTIARVAAIAAAVALPAADAAAQTFYPAFQPARTVQREYNFAIADGDAGTQFIFQWHEGLTAASGFRFDGGLIDGDDIAGEDGDVLVLLGATYLRQLNNAGPNIPLDLLFTVGGSAAIGDQVLLEVPAGISVGRRFPLDGTFALTPFVHPRIALQYCNECDAGDSETDLGIGVDLGVDFEISTRMSLRAALLLGSDDTDAIGLGLAWRPSGLRR